MKVSSVLVDEILAAKEHLPARVKSVLYEFNGPRWVSIHSERGSKRVGPISLLDAHKADLDQIEDFAVTEFAERALAVEGNAISYRETWTIPAGSVYALVLPEGFTATPISIVGERPVPLELATVSGGGLFYYATFREPVREYRIEARLQHKPDDCRRIAASAEIVEGTKRFEWLRSAVTHQALSVDFWFKLVTLVGKFGK
jgi:hypothetical protein